MNVQFFLLLKSSRTAAAHVSGMLSCWYHRNRLQPARCYRMRIEETSQQNLLFDCLNCHQSSFSVFFYTSVPSCSVNSMLSCPESFHFIAYVPFYPQANSQHSPTNKDGQSPLPIILGDDSNRRHKPFSRTQNQDCHTESTVPKNKYLLSLEKQLNSCSWLVNICVLVQESALNVRMYI